MPTSIHSFEFSFNILEALSKSTRNQIPILEGIGNPSVPLGYVSRESILRFILADLSVLWDAGNMTLGDLDIYGENLISSESSCRCAQYSIMS